MQEGEVKEKMAIPQPQVPIPNNQKDVANDQANDIILGLEAMAEGTEASAPSKTIEKTTAGKIMEVIKLVNAVISLAYVRILLNRHMF